MDVVVGLSLKNLKPRFWRPDSPYYLPQVKAVMVSYAEFDAMPARHRKAMERGLHAYLGVPRDVAIYLDNGSFSFQRKGKQIPEAAYQAFVRAARPDWYAVPQDFIPSPGMTDAEQRHCVVETMQMNRTYSYDGFVPVLHVSRLLGDYVAAFQAHPELTGKRGLAIGGIVPNLLRAPKAMPYPAVLRGLQHVREVFADKKLHLFGVGGTATLHLAALIGIDSVDSSGWRNRAARGIVQLPGRGDRLVAELGSWRGREPDDLEWALLKACGCPACQRYGVKGLRESKIEGFCKRATHNLWTLFQEAEAIEHHLTEGTYEPWYKEHIENSIYRPLIDYALLLQQGGVQGGYNPGATC